MPQSTPYDLKTISTAGEAMRDFIVNTTIEVCRARTVNYNPADHTGAGPDEMDMPGHEERVVTILERIFSEWQIPHYREARDPKRPSLFATLGKPGGRRLMYLLHTDTVPAGSLELWKFPPFDTFEKDGKLYGRGVLDNKGPMISTLAAMKILKQHEAHLPGEVVFAAIADEEVQLGYGLGWLLEQGKIKCDEAIVPDIAGEMKEINIAEKGRAVLRITAHGKAAHAMWPERGTSALFGLAAALTKLEKLKMVHKKHPLLGSPTHNLGLARGGSAPNAVADRADAVIDIRYVPGQKESAIKKQIKEICDAEAKRRPGLRFVVELERGAPPIEVKPHAPIVKAILRHAPKAKLTGTGGGTFAHGLVEHGIDAVGWSPGAEKTYHQPNEEIAVSQLTTFAGKLAAATLDRMNER
ncbi:MAG: M20/M25/M40 family metallo-hydrolase [Myxococcota bacterium]